MELRTFLEFDNVQLIAPLGISFGLNGRGADLFVLEVIGDEDSPIRYSDGRILAFSNKEQCQAAMKRIKRILPQGTEFSANYDPICDFSGALSLITSGGHDREAIVLDCINSALDFVMTGPFVWPSEHDVLLSLADHLTFREGLEEFNDSRGRLRDALLWCIGATVADLVWVRSAGEFEQMLPNLSATSRKTRRTEALNPE